MFTLILAILAVIWVVAAWITAAILIWRGWGPYIRSKRLRKTRVNARVSAKPGRQEINPLTLKQEFAEKALVFECEDGSKRCYDVHDDIWDWVEVGDEGVLIYQGHLFVGFEADSPRREMDEACRTMLP